MRNDANSFRRCRMLQALGVGACSAVAMGVAVYFQLVLRREEVYSHFAYVPIVLASVWWGRRGAFVAGALGALVILLGLANVGMSALAGDVVRAALFMLVALLVGELRERLAEGERALRRSEAKYRLLTEKSLAGIILYRNDRVLFANARMGALLACKPDELIGRSIWDMIYPEDRPAVRERVERRKREGFTDLHYECRLVRADGKMIWVEVASSAAEFEGEPAVLVHLYDISDRKEAEAKERELMDLARHQEEQLVHSTRLAELGEMAAAIAHELNQPLTGIKSFAKNASYMIEENLGTPQEVKENLRMISEQVDRASRIINQMRELTRRSAREFAPVDISSTLRESVEFLMPQFRLSGVEVSLELGKDLPPVMGDKVRLEQVFLNILTNARHAMEESPVRRLTVRTYFDAGHSCPVVTEIADTGIGFDPKDTEKLFRPFYSTKKSGHGTGLGLSISLSIIRDHQGQIEAHGVPGKGATFIIRLPAKAEEKVSA